MNYSQSLTEGILFTDFYQFTMAQVYYTMGMHEKTAAFEYFFRTYPDYGDHQAGYCITAGLEWFIHWLKQAKFTDSEIECLKSQTDNNGRAVFQDNFLSYLKNNPVIDSINLRAVPEGRAVHPLTPVITIEGNLIAAQLLETALLNCMNYQTLVATRASRMRELAGDNLIIDFGMRRAQGKGANAGTRAALIGGVDFTSNTGLSCSLGFPPKGTHAHSMVQAFMASGQSELDAFRAYSKIYPHNCLLLVDTINTLESGIPNAIKVFSELKKKGHRPTGIRLDSGDLAYLSIRAAKMLNNAGFPETVIVLSNQLDELVIWQIQSQIKKEAPLHGVDPDHLIKRLAYGIGTRLITSDPCPALDGIYKLTSIKDGQNWTPTIKLTESPSKTVIPGNKQLWRIYDVHGRATADYLTINTEKPEKEKNLKLHHPLKNDMERVLKAGSILKIEPVLKEIVSDGKTVYTFPDIAASRKQCRDDLSCLDSGVKRLVNPHRYHVSLSEQLWNMKNKLIQKYSE